MGASLFLVCVLGLICVLAGVLTLWIVTRLPDGRRDSGDDVRRR